ncbi:MULTISPECIES: ABC transporter permease [unclassified Modicisalibacter]|uniref:ABC transporter permease n=1 Tax=unclassified Modicisalibacter TaxID=2679913 RepID=UPI001CCCE30F|nr:MULTISPECIES: ABC transporter permease [unclassified Modicisalibacter]MBZ9559664.1 ABC transporter permease [Modicisalibacter sp. R2A 31.J]MBZ9577116.1 ABC transporter permease [Modicisalibacter sp. MOD 31.J]
MSQSVISRLMNPAGSKSPAAGELAGMGIVLGVLVVSFSLLSDRFLTGATFDSIAFQLPELGLLALAMLIPLLSGGLNLAITFSANFSALVMAWVVGWLGGPEAGMSGILLGMLAALLSGALIGWALGAIVAYTGAHPILASLAMMIFLRGLGEFLTRGSSVSGFPDALVGLGQGTWLGIPVPLLVFAACAALWALILNRTRLGFSIYMLGSNTEATRYSGISTRRALTLVYVLSGVMCAVAGIIMTSRFNSVRVGHGEAYLLITVLACFLGRVDPFGGFGRVAPVVMALIILQVISSGLNLLGTNQHLATALWGGILIAVMVVRYLWGRLRDRRHRHR